MKEIIDARDLVNDLGLVVHYAMRAGLLEDKGILQRLIDADSSLQNGKLPNLANLSTMLNKLIKVIHPVTLADLQARRDPFDEANYRKSRTMQYVLTLLSLVVLVYIGHFMNSLRKEQAALASIEMVKDFKPRQALTELRLMAQLNAPLARENAANVNNERYQQKRAELVRLNSILVNTSAGLQYLSTQPLAPLFPSDDLVVGEFKPAAYANSGTLEGGRGHPSDSSGSSGGGASGGSGVAGAPAGDAAIQDQAIEMCAELHGELVVPAKYERSPKWLKEAVRDYFSDFCFLVNVVGQGNTSALLSDSVDLLGWGDKLRDNVSLRVAWLLPFQFGILGAIIFSLRNIADVRTPAMEWHILIMRICMGGIAGIVVGWFVTGDTVKLAVTPLISVPFALAFLAGYSLDMLFNLLENLSRKISAISAPKTANGKA